MYEEASECDSCPRQEIVNDGSRHREGPISEFIRQGLNDYAKHIQGSVDAMREQVWNFSRDGNFFSCWGRRV